MQAGGQVGGLAERQLFLPRAAPHVTHHHQPGMDAQAHGQVHPPLLRQAGIELAQGLHDPQPGPHRPLGVIFVGQGVAKVDEQAIAEVLGDMPLKAGDHLGTGVLIGPHHLAQVFRVELAGERGRVHQVTEQHGELAAFGFWSVWRGWGSREAWVGSCGSVGGEWHGHESGVVCGSPVHTSPCHLHRPQGVAQ